MTTRKRGSHRNATKYGIFAKLLLSGDAMGETTNDYLELLAGLRKTFRPANCLAQTLTAKLAFQLLRLSRLYKCDAQSAPLLFAKVKENLESDQPTVETEFVGCKKEYQVVIATKRISPDLQIRYEANLERQIARTLEQLKLVQEQVDPPPELPEATHAH